LFFPEGIMSSLETSAGDGILTITLNRPESHNAMDPEMVVQLAARGTCSSDDSLRVAIVTGAGERGSSGADLKRQYRLRQASARG
jgi:enoyl-CoA hydratase/carnithine racemase